MTERLAQLMHAEADHLDVPPPDAGAALSQGRSLRRRRSTIFVGASALGVATVVAVGFALVGVSGDRSTRLPGDLVIEDPVAAAAAYRDEGAFAVGDDLYVGPNHFRWKESIKAVHYTSAGVVIQSGERE